MNNYYKITFWGFIFGMCFAFVLSVNKYSKEANVKFSDHFDDEPDIQIRNVEKPFRISKLNLLWSKARIRLTEPKLKSLYSELKMHDQEEISYKHYRVNNEDSDGIMEANLRKKLIGIMSTYDLLEHFQDMDDVKKVKEYDNSPDTYTNKNIFKDKKLNKLWMKAQMSGFTSLELKVLKEEFSHHQDKLDQYLSLLKEVETERRNNGENDIDEDLDRFNVIEHIEEPQMKFETKINAVRDKSRDLKDSYSRLERLAAQGPNSNEFVEPKVQGLWKLAVNGNFTHDELNSLRTELHHYEKRLLKLRNLHMEAAISKNAGDKKLAGEKAGNNIQDFDDMIKKQSRKVEKTHANLESKIISRNEL